VTRSVTPRGRLPGARRLRASGRILCAWYAHIDLAPGQERQGREGPGDLLLAQQPDHGPLEPEEGESPPSSWQVHYGVPLMDRKFMVKRVVRRGAVLALPTQYFMLTTDGAILDDFHGTTKAKRPLSFIGTESLGVEEVSHGVESLALTEDEAVLVGALNIIDPKIERVAAIVTDLGRLSTLRRGGVYVRREGETERLSLGSMGDGMWLLVDEIDTGVHYTALPEVWRFLLEVSEQLDVQVFATTHSRDCVEALAEALEARGDSAATVQRIEAGRRESVVFEAGDIIYAARADVEVR